MSKTMNSMSTRDIVDTFEEMYGVDISPTLVSQVTNSVMERIVVIWLRELIWRVKKNCRVCGYQKMKGLSSGSLY